MKKEKRMSLYFFVKMIMHSTVSFRFFLCVAVCIGFLFSISASILFLDCFAFFFVLLLNRIAQNSKRRLRRAHLPPSLCLHYAKPLLTSFFLAFSLSLSLCKWRCKVVRGTLRGAVLTDTLTETIRLVSLVKSIPFFCFLSWRRKVDA